MPSDDPLLVLYYMNYTIIVLGQSQSNLKIIEQLCKELEGFFEVFEIDKYWDEQRNKVTLAFTCQKIQQRYLPN